MENKRDNIIDNHIKDLEIKRTTIEQELNNLPKYETNLIVKTNDSNYNLRTCSTINEVYNAYKYILQEDDNIILFNNMLKRNDINEFIDRKINGYDINQWYNDVVTLCKSISLNHKLVTINNYINELEKFYSKDRIEEKQFDNLINDINGII